MKKIRQTIDDYILQKKYIDHLALQQRNQRYLEIFKQVSALYLKQLQDGAHTSYGSLLTLLGFFETVGLLVKYKLMRIEIINDLYDVEFYEYLARSHVEKLREAPGRERHYENFLWLLSELRGVTGNKDSITPK